MSDRPDSERDPLDLLIERFLEQHRAGEPVTPSGFAEAHPEYSEQLSELLPTLLALEDVKRDRTSSSSGQQRVSLPSLDRLGDFRIERELGRGGMGVVFEAVQEALDRRVALKVLPQASLLTGNQLERFQREAQIAARLHHTNIVPVYGSGESDGYHWYAMQFISGQSLDRWRQEQRARAPVGDAAWASRSRFVARVGAAAADALHCAHEQGTLHRDVKPGNFLLDHDDHVWVTDFGLAKALENDGLTKSGDLLGTLQYMAPEQFAGAYDVRSEVYALGVTLYETLTLRPAFRGSNRSELMGRVREQRVEPLGRLCPEVPADLAVIIEKAMERDPEDRYQDAALMQQDLEAFLEDRPIRARRLTPAAQLWRWCRRNRLLAGAISAAVLAIVVAAVTGWTAYGEADEARQLAQRESARAEANLRLSEEARQLAQQEGARAEANLRLSLAAFGDVFDALVGRDPVLDFEDDPDTGEQAVVVQAAVSQRDVGLLEEMLAFYGRFASENADSQSLRYETARAQRRVGAIHAQLGKPESLEVAKGAFERALEGFEGIADRDVRADLAQVHSDLGLLSTRRGRDRAAAEHFSAALSALQELPNAEASSVRLRRAQVLFDLYRCKYRSRRRREGPWESPEFVAAMAMLGTLLEERPDDPECLALQARCLREDARGPDGVAVHDEVVEIFRELATVHPERPEYRFEFCQAVLARARVRRGRGASTADLAAADALAEALVAEQPLFREYRSLLLRVRTRYASDVHRAAVDLDDDDRARQLALAYDRIRAALLVGEQAVQEDLRDLRYVASAIGGRGTLGSFLLTDGDREGALAQANLAMDLLERHVALQAAAQEAARGDGRASGRWKGTMRAELMRVDWEQSREFGTLLLKLNDKDLAARWRKLFSRR